MCRRADSLGAQKAECQNVSRLVGADGCAGLWLTPVIQRSEKKTTSLGWRLDDWCLLLVASLHASTERLLAEILMSVAGEGELVACDDMSYSSVSQTRTPPIPISPLPAGTETKTFLSLSISTTPLERGKKKKEKKTAPGQNIPFIGIIHTPSCNFPLISD